jgi:hypothetical protein
VNFSRPSLSRTGRSRENDELLTPASDRSLRTCKRGAGRHVALPKPGGRPTPARRKEQRRMAPRLAKSLPNLEALRVFCCPLPATPKTAPTPGEHSRNQGGGEGIRTPGWFPIGGFQNRCLRPLGHPSGRKHRDPVLFSGARVNTSLPFDAAGRTRPHRGAPILRGTAARFRFNRREARRPGAYRRPARPSCRRCPSPRTAQSRGQSGARASSRPASRRPPSSRSGTCTSRDPSRRR